MMLSQKIVHQNALIFYSLLIDKCINDLKKGKACGPDDISAEHLQHAHPSLVILLKLLFGMMVSHGFVSNDFGNGIIIPLIKDKAGDLNDSNNYRGTYYLNSGYIKSL